MRDDRPRLLLTFGAASLAAVAVGAAVCALSGVPAGVWGRNLVAWAVGALLALGIARIAGPRTLRFTPWLTSWLTPWLGAAALAATFLGADQQGVHRWVAAGPLSMNVAMLVLPAVVVALAGAQRLTVLGAWTPALASLVILVLQPDASQATALGLALVVIAALRIERPAARLRGRAALAAIVAAAIVMAWLRPDPLAPVPEVEEIVGLAQAISPLLAALALATLAAVALTPAWLTRHSGPQPRTAGLALGALLALWTLTTFAGAFPVPLVGVGLSPILGAWAGVGLLAALARRTS